MHALQNIRPHCLQWWRRGKTKNNDPKVFLHLVQLSAHESGSQLTPTKPKLGAERLFEIIERLCLTCERGVSGERVNLIFSALFAIIFLGKNFGVEHLSWGRGDMFNLLASFSPLVSAGFAVFIHLFGVAPLGVFWFTLESPSISKSRIFKFKLTRMNDLSTS